MILYHATFTRRVRAIRRNGIEAGHRPIWRKRFSNDPYATDGHVFAFEVQRDAVLWAARMGWEFFQSSASDKVSIVSFNTDRSRWVRDVADPLSQLNRHGLWLKSKTNVLPGDIVSITPLTNELVREAFKRKELA